MAEALMAVTRHLEWIQLGQHAVLTLPRGRDMNTKGDREPDSWRGVLMAEGQIPVPGFPLSDKAAFSGEAG